MPLGSSANLQIVITAKDMASRTLRGMEGKVKRLGGVINRGLGIAMKGAAVASGLLVAEGYRAIKAFEKQERAEARLAQAMKNQGYFTKKNYEELKKLAAARQQVTRFGDEETLSAQAMLASFKFNTEQIKRLTPAMQDLATMAAKTTGAEMDLENAAKLVGLAIEGQPGRLRQMGISLTDADKRALELATTLEEKTNIVLEIFRKNAGGLAEAEGRTLSGRLAILKNDFGDLEEKIGGAILRGLDPLLKKFVEFAKTDETRRKVEEFAEKVSQAILNSADAFERNWPRIRHFFQSFYYFAKKTINFFQTAFGKVILATIGLLVLALAGAAGNIGAICALIGGVVIALVKLWQNYFGLAREVIGLLEVKFRNSAIRIILWGRRLKSRIVGFFQAIIYKASQLIAKIRELASAGANIFRQSPIGFLRGIIGFQSGGFVPRTGIYELHRGERITSAGMTTANQTQNITINIYGNINNDAGLTIEEIKKELGRSLRLAKAGAGG